MEGAQRLVPSIGREAGLAEGLPAILPALLGNSAAVNSPGGKEAIGERKKER